MVIDLQEVLHKSPRERHYGPENILTIVQT